MTDIFHYPPELFQLLVETIPLLNRSKQSVFLFFKGAGVQECVYKDLSDRFDSDKNSINKYEICRVILTRINEKKNDFVRERREVVKRVVEFESFTNCWPEDQYKAKGLVAEIRDVVHVKDAFTRMKQEKESLQTKHSEEYNRKVQEVQKRAARIEDIKKDFYSLFSNTNPQERGKKLEGVLNSLFLIHGILAREAFARKGDNGEGIIEQIDGVVEIENQIYLVEMKWKKDKIGSDDIFAHLGRIYHRISAQGIFISASGFTDSGIIAAKEALTNKAILVLIDLEDFIGILDDEIDLLQYLKSKIRKAIIDKQPYCRKNG
ncbi:MAG: restriction endonuclease [Sphingobacteriaceae bacterium]|nr:MAG: restriction endonuclease [Sphingobacteriaceae bacterium]